MQQGQVDGRRLCGDGVVLVVPVVRLYVERLNAVVSGQIDVARRGGAQVDDLAQHGIAIDIIVMGTDTLDVAGAEHIHDHLLPGVRRIVGKDGVHDHGHVLLLGRGDAQGGGRDVDGDLVEQVAVGLHQPRDGDILAPVLRGHGPDDVHARVFLPRDAGYGPRLRLVDARDGVVAVATVALVHHGALHALPARHVRGVVAARDVLIRLQVEHRLLGSARRGDVDVHLRVPAVVVSFFVRGDGEAEFVRPLQPYAVVAGVAVVLLFGSRHLWP